jgi:hypothetical protein
MVVVVVVSTFLFLGLPCDQLRVMVFPPSPLHMYVIYSSLTLISKFQWPRVLRRV